MNTNIIIAIIVILVVVAGGFLFFGPGESEAPTLEEEPVMDTDADIGDGSSSGDVTSEVPAPGHEDTPEMIVSEGVTVTYTDSGYSPASVTISAGDTVTFVNESSRRMWPASAIHPTHGVYDGTTRSEHCPNSSGTAFDACEGLSPGASWSFTFTKVGSWKYHDHLRPSDTGTVTVE